MSDSKENPSSTLTDDDYKNCAFQLELTDNMEPLLYYDTSVLSAYLRKEDSFRYEILAKLLKQRLDANLVTDEELRDLELVDIFSWMLVKYQYTDIEQILKRISTVKFLETIQDMDYDNLCKLFPHIPDVRKHDARQVLINDLENHLLNKKNRGELTREYMSRLMSNVPREIQTHVRETYERINQENESEWCVIC
jgi:hypothetical protein